MKGLGWLGLVFLVGCGTAKHEDMSRDSPLAAPLAPEHVSEVFVLGTVHLRGGGDQITPAVLDSVHHLLAGYAPELIAVEALPPEEIARLESLAASGDASAEALLGAFTGGLLPNARLAQAYVGLTRRVAAAVADSLIGGGGHRTMADHQRVAMLFLAGFDLPNAWLHWSLAQDAVGPADSSIPPALTEFLDRGLRGADERITIGVFLAKQLGRSRIESIDDHIDDEIGVATGLNDALGEGLDGHPELKALEASGFFVDPLPAALATGDLLALYRQINTPEHLAADVAAQWHLFHRTALPSGADRSRAALWEARNLNIASRLRQAMALRPSHRVLVIIGASHKPFLDAYLAEMMDVRVRQLAELETARALTPPALPAASPPVAPE